MDDITIKFVTELRNRVTAVERKLMRLGIAFEVTEALDIRTWYLRESDTHDPELVLAKAQELDMELIAMAEVIHEYDPDSYETDN